MPDTSPFGREVRERRRSRDLTQEQLAELVGCAVITLKRIEYGTLRPSRQVAERLAAALAVPEADRPTFLVRARAPYGQAPLDLSPARRGYELGELIGSGGFGAVYHARQPAVARDVAVKVILPGLASQPAFIRRFEDEAQIVAQLEHARIVPLYDFWRDASGAYLVMRLMRGGSLRERLGRPWTLDAVLRLADEVGAALHVAHRRGIVHGDVKPANILLDEDGGTYLADFGIARVAAQLAVGETPSPVELASYRSPEQLRGEPITPAVDVYSLVLVLHELLVGAPRAGLAALRSRRPDVPLALDAILARATDSDPARCYRDVPALVDELLAAGRGSDPPGGADTLPARPTLTGAASRAPDNPYRGLRAFQAADAALFFGREALIRRLVARLAESRADGRFLALVGPSGSGKSSAVRAGLVPAIRRGAIPGSEHWFIAQLTPGAHPLEELEAALLRVAVNPPASLLEQIQTDARGLGRAVRRCLPDDERVELLLLIDQFEELWTLAGAEGERALLLQALAAAVAEPRVRLRVVVTLRADYFGRPLVYPGFADLMRERTEVVTPLSEAELEQAIIGPAAEAGAGVEPALVHQLLRDVASQPGGLPLLQYALTELFERDVLRGAGRGAGALRRATYAALGGIGGAIVTRAEQIVTGLGDADLALARQIFLRLAQPGDGADDTRRRAELAELPAAARPLLDSFATARLLTFDRDRHTGVPTVELAHEALLSAWARLRGWLDESRATRQAQRRLTAAAADWERAERDASFVASGARLAQLEDLAGAIELSPAERDFLAASVAERDRAASIERERVAALRASLTRSEAQRLAAEASRLLQSGGNAELTALLALRSIDLCYTPEGDAALAGAARLPLPVRALPYGSESVAAMPDGGSVLLASGADALAIDLRSGAELRRYCGHAARLSRVLATPDGLRVVTCCYGGEARVWDAGGALVHRLLGHCGAALGAALAPDGRRLATSGDDGTVRLWDLVTGAALLTVQVAALAVRALSWSPDGATVAAGGDDQVVRLIDGATGAARGALPSEDGTVTCLAYAPDGESLLIGHALGAVRLWDLRGEVRRLLGHIMEVNCAVWTRDGARVLTSGNDGTVRIWDRRSGAELRKLVGHNSFVFGIALLPDDAGLVSVSGESGMRLWDLRETPPPIFHGLTCLLALDGRAVVARERSGATVVSDARSGAELRRIARWFVLSEAAAVSADGRWLLSGDSDRVARLWDLERGRLARELVGHSAAVRAAAFSPDGHLALTGAYDFTARLWDCRTGEQLHVFDAHTNIVFGAAFSADGRLLATGSVDGTTRVWEAATRALLCTIPAGAACLAFAPDGRLVTGDWGGMLRVLDPIGGKELRCLAGHSATIWNLRCARDGRRVITASADGTARLWDLETGAELRRFSGHTGGAYVVDLSDDGRWALTTSADGVGQLWDTDIGAVADALRGRVQRDLTPHELVQYGLHDAGAGE